jgi:hypothetical protein
VDSQGKESPGEEMKRISEDTEISGTVPGDEEMTCGCCNRGSLIGRLNLFRYSPRLILYIEMKPLL